MSADAIMLIIAGAFAGGFANGLAGFGTGLFALGWWLAAMPPLDAVITVVIMSLVGGVQGLYAVRNAIDFGEQLRFLAPASIGIMVGYLFLGSVNVTMLKLLVASLLILFGGFFTFRKTLPKLTKRYLAADVFVGFFGGLFGMMAGTSGVILTMGCSLYDWSKARRRALVQPFNMIVLGAVLALMIWRGVIDSRLWLIVLVAFPFSVLGTQIGIFVFRRLNDRQFQRLLIWLVFMSGLVIGGRELFTHSFFG
jgi:uncharacterized membrane protein YfcA